MVTRSLVAVATSEGTPSKKRYPGIPGQVKTDAIVGHQDKLLGMQRCPICKTRSLLDPGYKLSVLRTRQQCSITRLELLPQHLNRVGTSAGLI